MNFKTPLIIASVIGALVLVWLLFSWQQKTIQEQQQALLEMRQLTNDIARSQSQYATKEQLDGFAQSLDLNLNAIKKDLEKLDATVGGINAIVAASPGYSGRGLPSTGTNPRDESEDPKSEPVPCPPGGVCPEVDTFGYLNNAQVLSLNEPLSNGLQVPIGSTTFKAWKEKPWDVEIFPRNYIVSTVIGQDEDGKHHVYNKFSVETQGQKYAVPIKHAEFKEQIPEPKFRVTPRLYLGVDTGVTVRPEVTPEAQPNLQVSIFSYGRTKTNPTWTFAGVGTGFEIQRHLPTVIITPVNYNLGQNLPLVDNLHVGPSISLDVAGAFSIMTGVRVGL